MTPAFKFLFFAILAGPSAWAASVVICSATEDPLLVRAEGITERVGDFVLNCAGGSAGQQIMANIAVFPSVPITNGISGNNVKDVVFTADNGRGPQVINAPRVLVGNTLTFDSVLLVLSSTGSISLRITNVRGNMTQVPVGVNGANFAPGTYTAVVTIDGRDGGSQQEPVTLTVNPAGAPVPMITSVTNAATFAAEPVAPGSLATIFGSNFAGQNVSVTFNGLPAIVLFSNNTQINLEVPPELADQTNALVVVTVDGRVSVALNVHLVSFAPGIFNGGVLNQDDVVNSATAPEAPGKILQIFATGSSGSATFSVQLAGQTITNLPYAGPAPGLNGVQQVNVMVPLNLPPLTTSIAVCGTPVGGGATICSPAVPLVIGPPLEGQRQSPFYWGTNAILYDAQDVDLIGSLGNPGKVGARITYYWSDIEPTPGNWQFTVYDGLVKRAASGQIPLLGILAYAMKRVAGAAASMQGDPWALSFCPPDDVEDFVTFAAKVVARYPAVLYWEIWNEPNTANFWRPSPDPIRYVELLKRSYVAIKAANPKAVVVLGGLSPGTGSGQVNTMSAASFLEAVYRNGGKNYFDAVGFHPYNGGVSPDLYLADYVNSVHDVMKQYEDGNKEVWVTEMGWFVGTEGDALSEAGQADYLSRAFTILYNLEFVERVYWYNLKDYANPAPVSQPPPSVCGPIAGTPVDYGLFRVDGSPRPAADAFKKSLQ